MTLASGTDVPSAETSARLIASHLFDEGVSRRFLHGWLTYRIKHPTDSYSLANLCDELQSLLTAGPRPIDVLVPLTAQAPLPSPIPEGWLTAQQVREWRKAHIPESKAIRQHGGVVIKVEAYDTYAAVEQARDRITTIRDRFRVGGRYEIVPDIAMWVAGSPRPQPTEAPPRRVEVYAFERQSALWSHAVRPDIEAAMELMAPLERGQSPAAVTGAWSAVESLLVGPGDDAKHVAVDRLALILAGGHLRAEMTSLAWAHVNATNDALSDDLRAQETNQARADLALRHLANGGDLTTSRDEDLHALTRVRGALLDPYAYVASVRAALEHPMRALYRQRNLLSHAGGTSGVAIKPTLERTAPLIAAAMDRIVHVALTGGQSALELAAVASVRQEALRGAAPSAALAILEV